MNHTLLARLVAEARGWTVRDIAPPYHIGACWRLFRPNGERYPPDILYSWDDEARAWAAAPDPLTWEVAGELLEEMAAEMPGKRVDMVFDYAPALDAGNWRYRWDCHVSSRRGEFPSWSVKASSPQLAIVLAYLRWRGVSEERMREALES